MGNARMMLRVEALVLLGLGAGAETNAPLAVAVIGGMITATLLTLVVVPVVYCYMDDLANWVRRRLGFGPAPAEAR